MNKKLFIIDLDGTLLHNHHHMTKTTESGLKQWVDMGVDIVIATGRPFRSSIMFYDALGLKTPIINYNGSLITSPYDNAFIPRNLTIDASDILKLFNGVYDHIENIFCEVKDDIYLLHDTEEIRPLLHYFNGASLITGDFNQSLDRDPNGCIIIAKNNDGEMIEQFVKDHLPHLNSRNWGDNYHYIIEVYTKQTTKGIAIEYVADYLGYDMSDVIAIGDAGNDIDMIEKAGLGVAMKNAQDQLKDIADMVLDHTNQEDGVLKFINQYLKEED
jgi:Cof subfamily protein (haloacid dehalogenase superfamily)